MTTDMSCFLQILADEHSYREAANLLDAVKQFMTHFDKYMHISIIKNIDERVQIIRDGLAAHISIIFKQLASVSHCTSSGDLNLDRSICLSSYATTRPLTRSQMQTSCSAIWAFQAGCVQWRSLV